jgi:hypothetical protein
MSKDSILVDLHKLLEVDSKGKDYFSHMLVALEVSEDGTPIGAVVKMKCSPILALGVIDLLHEKLSEARETVLEELSNYEKDNMNVEKHDHSIDDSTDAGDFKSMMNKAIESISHEDREFFVDSQKRAIAALMANDEAALKAILAEMRAYVDSKKKKGDDDSKGFDLNDFKGGF